MTGRKAGLGIQSKLLVMLLGVSVLSTLVIGTIGFVSGRQSLEDAAFRQLTSLRELRAGEVQRTFDGMRAGVILDSRNASAVAASKAFNAAFQELQSSQLSAEQSAAVDAYYENSFVPKLEERSGTKSDPAGFLPDSAAQRYLQYYYTIPFENYDEAIKVNDAGDGSAWSAVHAQYHDTFREMTVQLGYEDALLLDTEGNVVYSAYGGVDLGTNVLSGPYQGALGAAYEQAIRTNTVDSAVMSDFERYQPSLDVPTAWIVSPIGSGGNTTGALAVQIPIATINSVMTGDNGWKADGLGATGEVYLAGPDEVMRSVSRQLIEDPEAYVEAVVAAGTSRDIAEREAAVGGSILLQPVKTRAVEAALKGETGTVIADEYEGKETLVAYAPLEIPGVDWVIVAKMDSSEAFAPVNEFTRNLLISAAALILLVSLLSLLLAQVFTRPLRRLGTAVERVAAGDLGIEVDATSRDEFGDLGIAFNGMSRSLRLKADLLDEQLAENEKLLLTLMPETVARRYREGEETIAEDHEDVAVLFADIMGFDEYAASRASEASLADLNGIVRGFDEAADALGIERVRTLRDGYLASSGLVVPRLDNARRALDFAVEMRRVIERFNSASGAKLALRAGVDAGTVTSGLVGRSSIAYDLWGDAVTLAHRVQGASDSPGIFVSERVYDLLRDSYSFTAAESAGSERIWRLEESHG